MRADSVAGGIDVVFVDIGSVLVESQGGAGPAKRIAAELGLSEADRWRLDIALMTTPATSPGAIAAVLPVGSADGVVARVWREQLDEAVAVPGAAAAVQALHDAGFRIGLLSNIWEPYLRSAAERLPDVFGPLTEPELRLFSCRAGLAKPDPALYRLAIERAGVPAERIAMVGDSYVRDIAPAIDAGLATVWAPRPRERDQVEAVEAGLLAAPWRQVESIADVTPELLAGYSVPASTGGHE